MISEKSSQNKYFEAVGRRKTAVARVRLFKASSKTSDVEVNKKSYKDYFVLPRQQKTVIAPFDLLSLQGTLKATVRVRGGGIEAQAEAVRHGIARALVVMDEASKKRLQRASFLTRDSRMVERKKYGLKKARRAPQWNKR
ncbi:MAG: 30S ribosomal protein S9 [Candidatus Harrisonbacteria bacterium RIFCSPLOWO2_01_FULL_40_28]|uniref:Small ribosomal subunit protein uS9 n=1 Tax=Candidatus Harrisonbacteria bacterium RIFCSPLOWO2_01_FULL_40_28 TaxID=1798406 RepID=A0A1G1ZKC4_9BACT|nr:MAG: 30S ribosomal protein S9 [Candidatus Harrisonbacteria bacterium RIFCSPLOWO2_01_FULL_40_28]